MPSYMDAMIQAVLCSLCSAQSAQLQSGIVEWKQTGKVKDSTACVTVSLGVATFIPYDCRTGSSLLRSSSSPLKTSSSADSHI